MFAEQVEKNPSIAIRGCLDGLVLERKATFTCIRWAWLQSKDCGTYSLSLSFYFSLMIPASPEPESRLYFLSYFLPYFKERAEERNLW